MMHRIVTNQVPEQSKNEDTSLEAKQWIEVDEEVSFKLSDENISPRFKSQSNSVPSLCCSQTESKDDPLQKKKITVHNSKLTPYLENQAQNTSLQRKAMDENPCLKASNVCSNAFEGEDDTQHVNREIMNPCPGQVCPSCVNYFVDNSNKENDGASVSQCQKQKEVCLPRSKFEMASQLTAEREPVEVDDSCHTQISQSVSSIPCPDFSPLTAGDENCGIAYQNMNSSSEIAAEGLDFPQIISFGRAIAENVIDDRNKNKEDEIIAESGTSEQEFHWLEVDSEISLKYQSCGLNQPRPCLLSDDLDESGNDGVDTAGERDEIQVFGLKDSDLVKIQSSKVGEEGAKYLSAVDADFAPKYSTLRESPKTARLRESLASQLTTSEQHPLPSRADSRDLFCLTSSGDQGNNSANVVAESVDLSHEGHPENEHVNLRSSESELVSFELDVAPCVKVAHLEESCMLSTEQEFLGLTNDTIMQIKTELHSVDQDNPICYNELLPSETFLTFDQGSSSCYEVRIKEEFCGELSYQNNLDTVKQEKNSEMRKSLSDGVSECNHSEIKAYTCSEFEIQKNWEELTIENSCGDDNEKEGDDDSDDDDVIILEPPQQEEICITINDSSCSSELDCTPSEIETFCRVKSETFSGAENKTFSTAESETEKKSLAINTSSPHLDSESFSLSPESGLSPSRQDMEKKTNPKTPKSGTKDKKQTQSRPDSASQGSGHRNQHKNQGRPQPNQHRTPQKVFEPHWSSQAIADGIKRGELIVAPIRINPKNYEDAYIPLPDGKSDLFIGGMVDRNRALNSDVVVVQPYPEDRWRVFVEEFEFYEKAQVANGTAGTSGVGSDDVDNKDNDDDGGGGSGGEDSDDSGPDVIFETDSENEVDAAISRKSQQTSESGGDQAGLTQAVANLNISAGQTSAQDQKMLEKIAKVVNRINNKKEPTTPRRNKFSSVSEMAASGSPLARDLFGGGGLRAESGTSGYQFVQQTGKVVYIYERKHSLAASGRLKLMPDKNKNFALFSPTDSRVPRIHIPMTECPKDFYQRAADYGSTLYIARINKWEDGMRFPQGSLARSLGEAGQIEPETQAMLIEMDVDDSPFSEQVESCLPKDLPWRIPAKELESRKDMRKFCVFTIDPATARDLDDALHIEEIGEGMFEVGVHIADVSYFVTEGTALDEVAAQRATSCYLVQKVVPMLPRLLCEELCSLNPDHDRLAFSVIWVINEDGEIFSEWYGRSVIRSCVKLSYEHAQGFIDEPEKDWSREELPPITNSFEVEDIKKRVLQLNKIAINLRKQRFDNGALRLDQVKLQYSLNSDTGLPNGYSVYQQKDSNRLIEEFMLLANMAVAHKITKAFPDKAVLRRHPPPQVKPLMQVEELCENLGLEVDAGTAGSLQKSLWKHYGEDEFSQARLQVLIVLISKPMQNAKYFCSGIYPDDSLYHHYALNVPLYTHFTSPIRRYPDIMVHRLLAASLGYCDPPDQSPQILQRQADYCNDKKLNAKMTSERSSDMYFAIFVKEAGPLEASGMVMAVLDKSFDVLILQLGVVKRVYLERLPLRSHKFRKNRKCPELEIEWVADESCDHRTRHLITLFTMVECKVYADKEPLRCSCVIKRPKDEIKFVSANDENDEP